MKQLVARIALLMFAPAVLAATMTYSVSAQTQSLNAQLEGTVVDPTGAVVSHAEITATNLETGITRVTISDDRGIYRIPLLPLGTYRIVAEAPNFKRYVRSGIVLFTATSTQ